MENFPANTRKAKEEPVEQPKESKKIDPVVLGEVVRRKKPLGKRFMETFVGGSDAQSVWSYVLQDVLVPAAKDMITDAFTQGIERLVFGEVRGRRGGSRPSHGSAGYTSYNRYSTPGPLRREEPARREVSRRGRAMHDFDEIVIPTKAEADGVIDGMYALLSQYEIVTVADLYELCNMSGNFTDEKYGWTDLHRAGSTRVRGGYLLDLPRPEQLD